MPNQIENILAEFDKEFTTSYPGDSGLGGNYPQEPIYELTESDPKEYKKWLKDKLTTLSAQIQKETTKRAFNWIWNGWNLNLANKERAIKHFEESLNEKE